MVKVISSPTECSEALFFLLQMSIRLGEYYCSGYHDMILPAFKMQENPFCRQSVPKTKIGVMLGAGGKNKQVRSLVTWLIHHCQLLRF